MARSPDAPAPRPRRSLWIPWTIVGGFVAVTAVNVTLIYAAVSTFSGIDVRNSYEAGLAYGAVLEQAAAQDRLGWSAAVSAAPVAAMPGPVALAIRFADRAGRPLDGLAVAARLIRPAQAAHDLDVPLAPVGGGLYRAAVDLPMAGQWDVDVTASGADGRWHSRQRVFLR